MRKTSRIITLLLSGMTTAIGLPGAGQPAEAQSASSPTVVIEYYYKIAPGGMMPGGPSEWLTLYLKNHHPILRQLGKEGFILSEKIYERKFHSETPAWDYKVVMVWRDWAAIKEAEKREPDIIRSLYPDKAAHDGEEKRRWELTVLHWDDVLKEIPLE